MFTQDLKLTSIQQNYFSNYSFLAKDIKKILQLISKRELSLNKEISKIKHSRLVFITESIFKDISIENVSIKHLNDLHNLIKNYLKEFIENDYFIEELFKTLWIKSFCKDVIATKNNYLNRIKTCIRQLNKIIKEKNTNQYQKETHYDNIYFKIDNDLGYLDSYLATIRKQYSFVWYPKFFEEFYFNESIKEDNLYKENKINEIMDRLFELLENLVISYNLMRLHFDDFRDSYFIQENKNKSFRYAEGYYLSTEISRSFHGGMDMSGAVNSLNEMIKNHMNQKYGNYINKITWDDYKLNVIEIYLIDKKYGMVFDKDEMFFTELINDEEYKYTVIKFNEKYELKSINCRLKGQEGTLDELRGFFLYTQDNDYIEYKYVNENKFINIKLKINEIIIETEEKKLRFSCNDFFNIEPGYFIL